MTEQDYEKRRKPKRYLRKRQVAERYGGVSERTVDRMADDGRIPLPIYLKGSRFPLWDDDELDAADRQATRARLTA
jgi:predicted DNA-binding transcriptional regulator AlpA